MNIDDIEFIIDQFFTISFAFKTTNTVQSISIPLLIFRKKFFEKDPAIEHDRIVNADKVFVELTVCHL